jgi:hypothetical protein
MRVAAKAFHFKIAKPGVERIAQRRRWLRRSLIAEHALVPRLDGELVGLLAGFRRPLRRRPDRRAVDRLSRLGAHAREDAPRYASQASRYRLRWIARRLPALADQAAGLEIAQQRPLTAGRDVCGPVAASLDMDQGRRPTAVNDGALHLMTQDGLSTSRWPACESGTLF